MKIMEFGWLVCFILIAAGCYKEDDLAPSPEPEAIYGKYTLPQGNHDYDPEILEIYKKYSTLILYKFEDKDYWWAVSSDIRWKFQEGFGTIAGYEAAPADEKYVGQQMELVKNKFLKYFPDTLLQRVLPLKILLTSYFNYIPYMEEYPTDEDKQFLNAYWGYDYLGLNWGNEKILTMTAEERNLFKSDVCTIFLQNSYQRTMESAIAFFAVSNYASNVNSTPENGFIADDVNTSPDKDWLSYIAAIVSTPYESMLAEGGILNEAVDTEGKVREKYDIMIGFFKKTYNVDLQAIGNDVE